MPIGVGASPCLVALGLLGPMVRAPTGGGDRSARGDGDRGAMTRLVQKDGWESRRKGKPQAASPRASVDQARTDEWIRDPAGRLARQLSALPQIDRRRLGMDRHLERPCYGALSSALSYRMAGPAGSRRPSSAGARPERTRTKFLVDRATRSPRLDQLPSAECSHCDGPAGRLVRHDARVGGHKSG